MIEGYGIRRCVRIRLVWSFDEAAFGGREPVVAGWDFGVGADAAVELGLEADGGQKGGSCQSRSRGRVGLGVDSAYVRESRSSANRRGLAAF